MNPAVVDDYSNPQQGPSMVASPHDRMHQNNNNSENHQAPRKAFKVPPTRRDDRKIFVGGLPSNVTDEEFHQFFSQFGTVVDSIVMFDRETRRSRGFGFVTFEDPNVVRLLLEMRVEGTDGVGRVQMRGKVCEIKAAQPKEASSNNYHARGRRGSGNGNNNNNKGYRSYPPQVYPANGDAYAPSQGYPSSPEIPGQVNQGVPSSLPMTNGHPAAAAMYSPYGMHGAYYPHSAAMPPAAYPPYVGYPPDGSFYELQGNTMVGMDAYGSVMPSAMTATAPGPQSQPNNEAYGEYVAAAPALYGNAFVPVEDNQSARQEDGESPQGTNSNGEAGNQP